MQELSPCHWDTPVGDVEWLGRATVCLLIAHEGGILTVKPTKGESFAFVQGGIEDGETIHKAGLREAFEEVGLPETELVSESGRPHVVFRALNPIPPERQKGHENNDMVFLILHVNSREWVRLNEENEAFEWVDSPERLVCLMGNLPVKRPVKNWAMRTALKRAKDLLAFTWSFEDLKPA